MKTVERTVFIVCVQITLAFSHSQGGLASQIASVDTEMWLALVTPKWEQQYATLSSFQATGEQTNRKSDSNGISENLRREYKLIKSTGVFLQDAITRRTTSSGSRSVRAYNKKYSFELVNEESPDNALRIVNTSTPDDAAAYVIEKARVTGFLSALESPVTLFGDPLHLAVSDGRMEILSVTSEEDVRGSGVIVKFKYERGDLGEGIRPLVLEDGEMYLIEGQDWCIGRIEAKSPGTGFVQIVCGYDDNALDSVGVMALNRVGLIKTAPDKKRSLTLDYTVKMAPFHREEHEEATLTAYGFPETAVAGMSAEQVMREVPSRWPKRVLLIFVGAILVFVGWYILHRRKRIRVGGDE